MRRTRLIEAVNFSAGSGLTRIEQKGRVPCFAKAMGWVRPLVLAVLISILLVGCVLPAPKDERFQFGGVRSVDGLPCFTTGDSAEAQRASSVRVAMIDVHERSGSGGKSIWRSNFIPDEGGSVEAWLPLGECIAYPTEGGPKVGALAVGKAYSASISAVLEVDGDSVSRTYVSTPIEF